MNAQAFGARNAPIPKELQVARIVAAGASPLLAVALADLLFPATKRDDCATLVAVTMSRCSAASMEARS